MVKSFESYEEEEGEEGDYETEDDAIDYSDSLLEDGWYFIPFLTADKKLQHLSLETKIRPWYNYPSAAWGKGFARNLSELMRNKDGNIYITKEFGGIDTPSLVFMKDVREYKGQK